MSGRKRLIAVSALTVSTMLLGGGALSAFAAEKGGRGHGGEEWAAVSQHQPVAPTGVSGPAVQELEKKHEQQVPPGLSAEHENNGLHVGEMREHEDEGLHKGDGWGNILRQHDDDDDLVTPPVRVTETPRPCMDGDDDGCRVLTPKHHGDDDDQGVVDSDDSGDD